MDNAIPEKLGRYEIVRVLGRGAMGVVYEGRDPQLGRRVAIKTTRREVLADQENSNEVMERFLREAKVAGMLNHPNIITIYDAGEERGTAFIAMEYVEGEDLATRMAAKRRPDIQEAVFLIAVLAEALACAHDQGVVHRDIKPANIMLPWRGPVKIADFGIARIANSNLTQDGTLIGTPNYMSPEQFMGHRVDGRSDLFSLAIILYELLTGEKPFTGEAFSTIMHHVLRTAPAPVYELNFSVPNALGKVVEKAMRKRPQDRYADGRLLAAALRESLKEHPDPKILEGYSPAEALTVRAADTPTVAVEGGAEFPFAMPEMPATTVTSLKGDPIIDDEAALALLRTKESSFAEMSAYDSGRRSYRLLSLSALIVLVVAAGAFLNHVKNMYAAPSLRRTATTLTERVPLKRIQVSVYVTSDPQAITGFTGFKEDPAAAAEYVRSHYPKGAIRPYTEIGATVVVSDPSNQHQYATEPLTEDGSAIVAIPGDAPQVMFVIKDANGIVKEQLSLNSPSWQSAQTIILFDPLLPTQPEE